MIKDIISNLRLPIISAPMFLVSGPDLVVAACKSGVIGSFPTPNCRTKEDLEAWMASISTQLEEAKARDPKANIAPWAANLVTHSSNARLADDLALVAKYKPAIVITALGSPLPAMQVVKSYGGMVFADVVNIKLAKKAAEANVDGLVCVSAGAGGHTGQLSPFAFVSAVREFFAGTIVVGGGISDGAGIAGALAAGADMAYLGTRFLASTEAIASEDYKQMVVDHGPDDLIVSDAITGTHASWLRPSLVANGLDPDTLVKGPGGRNYNSVDQTALKKWKDVWAAGQGLQTIRAVEPVSQIVDRLEAEFSAAREDFLSKVARS